MGQMIRHCHDCGTDQMFDQPHDTDCPDAPDGDCPEWACTGCGAALLAGPGVQPGVLASVGGPPGWPGQAA